MRARRKSFSAMRETAIIETSDDIRSGIKSLRRKCLVMRGLHDVVGDPPLRREPDGFKGVAGIIVAQQVSAASAGAIWKRTEEAVRPFAPRRLLAATDETLRGAGLSAGKIATLRAVADAVVSRRLDLDRLTGASDDGVRAALTDVRGIGPWTADIYLMFCLGRRDAFAAGDLALQLSAEAAFALKARPTPDELLEIAERWRPWRGVAARLLWAHYAHAKRLASAAEKQKLR